MARSAIQMVPFGWSPAGANFSASLGNIAALLAFDTNIINQITNYVTSASSSVTGVLDDLTRLEVVTNLQNDFARAQGLYEGFTDLFDISNFSIPEGGDVIDDTLNVGTDILTRVETIIGKYDEIESLATDVMSHIEDGFAEIGGIPEKIDDIANTVINNITDYASSIESTIDNFASQLNGLVDFDVDNMLNNLPDVIQNNIMDITIVSDGLLMLQDLQASVMTITTNLLSLRAPTSILSLRTIITDLKGIIQQIQQVKNNAQRFYKSIEQLQALATSGNYVSLLIGLAQGGVSFFEHPPTYAAVYPHNAGYRTHGGHVHEEDNTPGKERKFYQHPSGTQVAVHPEGATNIKSSHDLQASAKGYIDMNAGADMTIVVKGQARIIADTAKIETSGNTIISAGSSCNIISQGSVSVTAAGDARVNCLGTAVVNGTIGVEVSTNGILTLSATTGIQVHTKGFISFEVGTNWTEGVLGFKTVGVGGYQSINVGGYNTIMVGKYNSVTVGGYSSEKVGAYKSVTVGGYYDEKTIGYKDVKIGAKGTVTCAGLYSVMAPLIKLN